jgi:iron complex transport system substrate-binding protein
MKYRGDLTVSNLRKLQAAAMALALAALLGGCGFALPPAGPAGTPTPELMVLTDSRGQEVRVPSEVRRIVSLAPSNTEILFAMGLGDTVVGVTSLCDYPEEAQEIEKVGDLMEMNVEKVVALAPDLVLGTEGIPEVVAKLEEVGVAVLVLQPTDLESIYDTIDLVGQATGEAEAATALIGSMRDRVDAVTGRMEAVEERPKVYYELDATDPAKPYTAGPGTWHDQFIRLAGGVNVAGEVDMRWVQFSTEEIISQDPDIIVLGDANWGVTADDVAQRPGWNVIAAVREGDIYPIDDNLISRPGPRLVEGLEALARIIHPELAR